MIIITFNNLKSRTTEPIQSNSTQITNPCSKHHISQIINNTSQNHENKTINMKYKESIEKPIPFCRSLKMKRWVTMEVFVRNTVGLREVLSGRQWKDTKCSRENPNVLKKLTKLRKTHDFCDWFKSQASRQGKSRDSLKPKFLKIFLSVFRD